MNYKALAVAAALCHGAGIAAADPFTDRIVADLTGQGFTFVDIKTGVTQVKVEAIRGTSKLEVIYDRTTGNILKQEVERAEADEIGRTGVRIRDRGRDFVRAASTGAVDVISLPDTPGSGTGAPPTVTGTVVSTQQLVDDLAAQGFTFFEVKNGPTQTKVEAIRGGEELEIVFDRATGTVLKQEVGAANPEDAGRVGLEIDNRNRDFLRVAGAVTGRSGSGSGSTRRGSEDDNSGSGSSGSNSGSGSSNSGSGSSNSGSGSSNSGSGNSNSGSGSSNSGSGNSGSGSGDDD